MYACNEDVTIWNRIKSDGIETFIRTILPVKCKWDNEQGGAQGAGARDTFPVTVIIPDCDKYLPEGEWIKRDDRAEYFTIRKGDLLALGAHSIEITGISPNTISGVKTMLMPECIEIKAYTDNTRLRLGKHIKAEGA